MRSNTVYGLPRRKIKDSCLHVCAPHKSLKDRGRKREREREGMRKGGAHDETKKVVDLSGDREPLNCNQLCSTLDNEMFQYMAAHTQPHT